MAKTITAPEVVTITPALALEWLKLNTANPRKFHRSSDGSPIPIAVVPAYRGVSK